MFARLIPIRETVNQNHIVALIGSDILSRDRANLDCDTTHNYSVILFSLSRACHNRNSFMTTSSNGNIFRVTGPLCGEFTGPVEFPTQRPVTRSFDVFFVLSLNKRLSKQLWGWWFETLSSSLWRHCNVEWKLAAISDRELVFLAAVMKKTLHSRDVTMLLSWWRHRKNITYLKGEKATSTGAV